jgi:hypothetical protein
MGNLRPWLDKNKQDEKFKPSSEKLKQSSPVSSPFMRLILTVALTARPSIIIN